MAEKKYYWLRLQNDFFTHKEIKKLRKIAGGDTYTIIYLKMLLLSLQNQGILYYDGLEDSFAEEVALDLDEDTENVHFTMLFLKKHGLIEEKSETEVSLPATINSIGGETSGAIRVRRHRAKQKTLQCNEPVTLLKQNVNGDIDTDIELDLNTETNIEENSKKKTKPKKEKEEKIPFAEFVTLKQSEYNTLLTTLESEQAVKECITILDNYKGSSGRTYESDYRAILSWVIEKYKEKQAKGGNNGKPTNNNGKNVFEDKDLPNQTIL
jgi:predicted phage replisome organizer